MRLSKLHISIFLKNDFQNLGINVLFYKTFKAPPLNYIMIHSNVQIIFQSEAFLI